MPQFELIDHRGQTIRLRDLRGRIVLVTAIFSRCDYSCPVILSDLQDAISTLSPEQLEGLCIAVITLDPKHDTPEVLANVASTRGFKSPPFHLLSGDPNNVEQVLDKFAIPRSNNTDSGVIDHANLLILIDQGGRVAYRFTLNDRRRNWLGAALKKLLAERADVLEKQ